jgi:hypothetical protein
MMASGSVSISARETIAAAGSHRNSG